MCIIYIWTETISKWLWEMRMLRKSIVRFLVGIWHNYLSSKGNIYLNQLKIKNIRWTTVFQKRSSLLVWQRQQQLWFSLYDVILRWFTVPASPSFTWQPATLNTDPWDYLGNYFSTLWRQAVRDQNHMLSHWVIWCKEKRISCLFSCGTNRLYQ